MTSTELKVTGMSCGHCVSAIEGAVQKAGATAKVDLANKSVSVHYDAAKVSLEAIKEAIEDQGYDIG